MRRTIIVNEKKIDELYVGKDFEIPSYPMEILSTEVSARPGAVFTGKKVGTLEVDVPIIYWNREGMTSKQVTDMLIKFFHHNLEASIHFEGEDWYWMGYLQGDIRLPFVQQEYYSLTIRLKLLSPYKYSLAEYSNMAVHGQVAVDNKGTVDTYPVIEAKALKDTTHLMVTKNDDDYIMIGEPPNANKNIKKLSPIVLKDTLYNLNGWDYIGPSGMTFADNETGGMIGAYAEARSGGIFVKENKYPPAPNSWIGTCIKRAFTRTVQDFEHKFTIKIYEDNVNVNKFGTGKVFTHIWDENGRVVAAIGLVDASYQKNDLTVIAKLFDETGESQTIIKYVPKWDNYLDDFAYCSIRRHGRSWTFSINTIKTIKMTNKKDIAKYGKTREIAQNVFSRTYKDTYQQYQQPIRTTSIYIARFDWGDTSLKEMNDFKAGAFDIQTSEIISNSGNDVDMLIEQGDKIVIDNYNQSMLINKQDATKHKDFGSNYFGLKHGQHELFIYPPDAFDVTVRWQSIDY